MALWDNIETDNGTAFVPLSEKETIGNEYHSNTAAALKLISKILSFSKTEGAKSTETVRNLDKMLDEDFMSPFAGIQLQAKARTQAELLRLSDKLSEQKKYKALKAKPVVGIGGMFSAGKSKFINSLLKAGEELLPEGLTPTTSIPTYIAGGVEDKINAYTVYNSEIDLTAKELQALTHKFYEKYGIGFSFFLKSIIITEPDMPYKDLVFLDTPGYNKPEGNPTFQSQKELTDANKAYQQLRGTDYLIWLMDIENGVLINPDIEFIRKLDLGSEILIIVNKADKKTEDDVKLVLDSVRETVKSVGIPIYGVCAYSSKDNREYGNTGLIAKFLENAGKLQKSKDDIFEQVNGINSAISNELEEKKKNCAAMRNNLSDAIAPVNGIVDIMQIKTLAELYSESMEHFRELANCQKKHKKNSARLTMKLEEYYKGE